MKKLLLKLSALLLYSSASMLKVSCSHKSDAKDNHAFSVAQFYFKNNETSYDGSFTFDSADNNNSSSIIKSILMSSDDDRIIYWFRYIDIKYTRFNFVNLKINLNNAKELKHKVG